MSQRIQVPLPAEPIGRTKDGQEIFATDAFRKLFERLAEGSGRSTTGFPDADLIGIPTYDILAQIIDIQERLLTLEGRVNEREQDPRQELLDLASLTVTPSSGLQGPASTTDNAVARWDGATGQKLQNSAFIVDDNGNISSFGGSITFPGAGTRVLSDWRIGTFTPTLGDGTNNYTLSTAFGSYTKKGDEVTCHINCVWSSIGSAGASQLRVGALPFTSANVSGQISSAAIGHINGLDLTATLNPITADLGPNATVIGFYRANDNAAPTDLPANSSSATGRISLTITYKTSS